MALIISTGGVLSYLTQPATGAIATASIIAFAISETVDSMVYHYTDSINKSNVAGAFVDSLVFPVIAFGGFSVWIFLGQFLTKTVGGFMWYVILRKQFLPVFALLVLLGGRADAANIQLHSLDGEVIETLEVATDELFAFVDHTDTVVYGEASYTPKIAEINPTLQCEFGQGALFPIEEVMLVGVDWKGAQVLYRSDKRLQFTYAWFKQFGPVQFTGFVDVTKDDIIAQPQVWYCVSDMVAIGSEVQVCNEKVEPTVGIKISFR